MDGLLYVPRIRVSDLHKEMKEDFRFNGYEEHDIPKESTFRKVWRSHHTLSHVRVRNRWYPSPRRLQP